MPEVCQKSDGGAKNQTQYLRTQNYDILKENKQTMFGIGKKLFYFDVQ